MRGGVAGLGGLELICAADVVSGARPNCSQTTFWQQHSNSCRSLIFLKESAAVPSGKRSCEEEEEQEHTTLPHMLSTSPNKATVMERMNTGRFLSCRECILRITTIVDNLERVGAHTSLVLVEINRRLFKKMIGYWLPPPDLLAW